MNGCDVISLFAYPEIVGLVVMGDYGRQSSMITKMSKNLQTRQTLNVKIFVCSLRLGILNAGVTSPIVSLPEKTPSSTAKG